MGKVAYQWVEKLREGESLLTRTESDFVDFVNRYPEKVTCGTLKELAKDADISKPVMINCYKKLGYSSYRSFQTAVEEFFSSQIDSLLASQQMQNRVRSADKLLREAIEVDRRALERLSSTISTADLKAIASWIHNGRTVYLMGEGTGHYPAHYLSQRLRRYGVEAVLIDQDFRHVPDLLHPAGDMDLILLFHYSDRDDWLKSVLHLIASSSMRCLLFSGTIHPNYYAIPGAVYHIPRGEIGFKNSMAVPMHFANQILLFFEILFKEEVEDHLTKLETSRQIWNREKINNG